MTGLHDRLEEYGRHVRVDAFYPDWEGHVDSPLMPGEAEGSSVHPGTGASQISKLRPRAGRAGATIRRDGGQAGRGSSDLLPAPPADILKERG